MPGTLIPEGEGIGEAGSSRLKFVELVETNPDGTAV